MNSLTLPTITARSDVRELHALLQRYGYFLVTSPSENQLFGAPAGGIITQHHLARYVSWGILNWAEYEVSRSHVPVVDVVDYWCRNGIYPYGVPAPAQGRLYRYGDLDARAELDIDEILQAPTFADTLARVELLERLSSHARRLA